MKDNLLKILPPYTPPDEVWDKIEDGLTSNATSAMDKLPLYEPPQAVWESIEKELVTKKPIAMWYYVAASVAMTLVAIGLYVINKDNAPQLTYSEEKYAQQNIPKSKQQLDQQYARIEAFCQKKQPVCEDPNFKQLKSELDQLTVASHQLQEAIGNYNTDENLSIQLADIERERQNLLRKLEQKI